MRYKILFLFLIAFLLISLAYAETCDVYFFYSTTCPYCAKEKPFLEDLEKKYPELNIQHYDIAKNYDLFKQICEQYNTIPVGVPRTFIKDRVFIGFTEQYGELEYSQGYEAYNGYKNQIEKAILDYIASIQKEPVNITTNETCVTEPVKEPVVKYTFTPLVLLVLYLLFFIFFKNKIHKRYLIGVFLATIIVILFYLSQSLPKKNIIAFAEQFSFPVFTFIIALLDGFNPCAFAVLAVLLSLLVYAQSRKKMALVGIIFILTSGIMYFLFIIVLLTLRAELLGAYKDTIRIIVACIALIAGSINIKDFFFFKKGISLTISREKMSSIVKKMRDIVEEVKKAKTARALFIAILGTIILAALVNLIELGCTLILPIEYIEVLITNYGTHINSLHYWYVAFYSMIYIIPLFAILASFLYTFKSERITETKGRILKLIGGLVMIGLGLILLFKPELLTFG